MKCPILTNHHMTLHGECKRYHFCDDERLQICGAKPISLHPGRPYSQPGKNCPHKHTTMRPTDEKVFVDGERKSIFEVVCRECGDIKKLIL